MNLNTGIASYRNTQMETMSPARLILLLFQKLDEELQRAKELILSGDMEGKGKAIIKSQDIVMELLNSLNLKTGQIAENLQALYLYIFRELNNVNFYKDTDKLNVILKIVDELKTAWEEITLPKPVKQKGQSQKMRSEIMEIVG